MPKVLQVGCDGVAQKEITPEEYMALVEHPRAGNGSSSPIVAPLTKSSTLYVEPGQDAAARARFDKHRKKRGPLIVTKEVDGEEWYFKYLSGPEIDLLFMLTPRVKVGKDEQGNDIYDIDLAAETTWDALRPAILHVGLAASATDDTPYMSLELAHEIAADRSMGTLVFDLCGHVSNLNPEIVPKAPGPKTALSSSASPGNVTTVTSPTGSDSLSSITQASETPLNESQAAADST